MTIDTTALMSLEDYMQKYSDEGAFELIDGNLLPIIPQTAGQGIICGDVFYALNKHLHKQNFGEGFIQLPYMLMLDDTNWVKGSRVPDMMFYTQARFTEYTANTPDWQIKPMILVPDFAVEVVSPTDRFSDVNRKVMTYLADGVKLVWVIDPQAKTIQVYSAESDTHQTFKNDMTISADPIVPDFELSLTELFG